MRRSLLLVLVFILPLAACEVDAENTTPVPGDSGSSYRNEPASPVATPVPLPFENPFPDRWNSSNDGTPYEPCIAFSDSELRRFQIDPEEIEDAAIVNGQGIRGCSWFMPSRFSLSNLVADSRSLEIYKAGTKENNWLPDISINDRVVGLFSLIHGDSKECSTYVQSYSAAVVTNVVPSTSAEGKAMDTCKLAIDFTRAYIDKIPG